MTTASSASVTLSSTVTVEAPTREELAWIFAKRFPSLSLQQAGVVFDEYLRLRHLDIGRDELTGEWRVNLSGKQSRQ
jgi:hypothetical protein